jgi:hypothetical protein
MNVIVVAGDGDTASIGGNHLIHTIRRNAPVTVLCNNNEIYGLTGGQTGPTTPTGTKTLSSPGGNPNTPINLQGLVRSSPHALYAKTTVYHQLHMRNAIREAIEWPGFSFVDITSQCIENNGRRIGFASANEMLTFYRKTYKRASKDATHLDAFEIGIVYPLEHPARNGNGDHPDALPPQPAGPMTSATESPGDAGATSAQAATAVVERQPATDDEKARRRAESQQRAALMSQLDAEVKMRVAKREITLAQALAAAGLEIPEWLRSGASAPTDAPEPPGEVEPSASGADPESERKSELNAQKAEAAAEGRNLVGGLPGTDTQLVAPRTAEDARPASVRPPQAPTTSAPVDPKEAKRAEAQRKLALMQRLPSELKLRVAKREISLEDAMREAGIDPSEAG